MKKPRELQPAPDDFKQMAYKVIYLEENLDAMRKAADYWQAMYEAKCRESE